MFLAKIVPVLISTSNPYNQYYFHYDILIEILALRGENTLHKNNPCHDISLVKHCQGDQKISIKMSVVAFITPV